MQEKLSDLKEEGVHGTKYFPCAIYHTHAHGKGMFVKHHWHDEVEILYFSGGKFRLEINMEAFDIETECLYFINPGELHSISSKSIDNYGEDAIVFHMGILSFDNYDATQVQLIQPIINNKLIFPRCIQSDHPAYLPIRQAFCEILENVDKKSSEKYPITQTAITEDLSAQLFIKSSLLNILACLSSFHLFSSIEKNYDKRVEGIKSILAYIKENYKEKIYIRELADHIGMNEQYFCRFFRKAIGKSPMEYVNDYRIKQAIFLLKTTEMPVTDICLECGFNNLGNFLREFKKITGTTPLKYRKANIS